MIVPVTTVRNAWEHNPNVGSNMQNNKDFLLIKRYAGRWIGGNPSGLASGWGSGALIGAILQCIARKFQ